MPKLVNALLWLCWCLFLGVAISTLMIFPKKVVNTSIMDRCHSTALGLHKMQHPKLLTLYWHSVDAVLTLCSRSLWGAVTSTFTIFPIKAANNSIMGTLWSTALGLYKIQHQNVLTLCWRSVYAVFMLIFRWSDIEINNVAYKGGQYFNYWPIP